MEQWSAMHGVFVICILKIYFLVFKPGLWTQSQCWLYLFIYLCYVWDINGQLGRHQYVFVYLFMIYSMINNNTTYSSFIKKRYKVRADKKLIVISRPTKYKGLTTLLAVYIRMRGRVVLVVRFFSSFANSSELQHPFPPSVVTHCEKNK